MSKLIGLLAAFSVAAALQKQPVNSRIDDEAKAASSACTVKKYDEPPLRIGKFICLRSHLLDSRVRAGFFALDPKVGDIIVVDDLGGDVDIAMDLGDFIYEHDNLVVVDGVCFSACANHIALGARRLALVNNGALSFHIGPASDEAILRTIPEDRRGEWLRISHRAFRFFKRRHIDPAITYMPPPAFWDKPASYWWMHGWLYSVSEMRRFGVGTVVHCDGLSCLPRLNPRPPKQPLARPDPVVFGPPEGWTPDNAPEMPPGLGGNTSEVVRSQTAEDHPSPTLETSAIG